jgi:hypothetical protein
MGRGRAKAKQQKVARELKYNSHFTDLDALQRELGVTDPHDGPTPGRGGSERSDAEDDYDGYDDWAGTER